MDVEMIRTCTRNNHIYRHRLLMGQHKLEWECGQKQTSKHPHKRGIALY